MSTLALRHPRVALALVLLVTAWALIGVGRLHTGVGYRALLGPHHPALERLDRHLDRFGGGLPVAAVWTCGPGRACESALDEASLQMAAAVGERLAALPGVRRVDSPATAPVLVPAVIGLPETRWLASRGRPASDLAALVPHALADPLWVGQLVSADGRTGAVLVHLAASDGETSRRVVEVLRAALAPWEARGFAFALVGGPVEFVVAGAELEATMRRIVPLMVGLIALMLTLLLGSVRHAVLALAAVGLAVLWVLGLMGWLGWPQSSLTQALAPLVLTVGVCAAVHLLTAWGRRGGDAARAAAAACREVARPSLLTALTTAAGFASLATSPVSSIAQFGVLAATGALVALLLTFTIVPIGLTTVPGGRPVRRQWTRAIVRLTARAQRRPAVVWALTAVVLLASGLGLARLRIDASFEDLYGEDSLVVQWARQVGETLRRPDTLEIAVTAGSPIPPDAFRVLDVLAERLAGVEGLGRSWSVLPSMRRLNEVLHRDVLVLDGREDEKGRPASLLRLLASEEPEVIASFVDAPTGGLRLVVEADKLPQDRLRTTLAAVHRHVAAVVPSDWPVTVTGPLEVVQVMIDAIRTTQLRSFATAAAIVFGLVVVFFRSLRLGLLAMVPTGLPVLVTLGLMGLLGRPLDVGSAMVAAVVLGIAIDDAIYVLTARERALARGHSPRKAMRMAIEHTGHAVVTTSIALAVGFLTLLLSPWHAIASFGMLATAAVVIALLAVLVVLPATAGRPRTA